MVKLNMTGVHPCMVSRPMTKPTLEAKLFASINAPLTTGLNGFQSPPLWLAQSPAKRGLERST